MGKLIARLAVVTVTAAVLLYGWICLGSLLSPTPDDNAPTGYVGSTQHH